MLRNVKNARLCGGETAGTSSLELKSSEPLVLTASVLSFVCNLLGD